MTARRLSFLLLRRPEDRTGEERAQLAHVRAGDPAIEQIAALAEDFARIVRERTPERLDPWLAAAGAGGVPEVRGFAGGVRRDFAEIRAALETPHSSGQVEGQITKRKLLKRQGYGSRAKVDLLGKRMLLAS